MKQQIAIALNNRTGMQDANQGKFDQAMGKLTRAVMLAKELKAPLLVAVSKNNMGIVCQMAGNPADARTCFTIARQTVEQVRPADHPLIAIINRNMARLKREPISKAA